jgi:hypothetical protein
MYIYVSIVLCIFCVLFLHCFILLLYAPVFLTECSQQSWCQSLSPSFQCLQFANLIFYLCVELIYPLQGLLEFIKSLNNTISLDLPSFVPCIVHFKLILVSTFGSIQYSPPLVPLNYPTAPSLYNMIQVTWPSQEFCATPLYYYEYTMSDVIVYTPNFSVTLKNFTLGLCMHTRLCSNHLHCNNPPCRTIHQGFHTNCLCDKPCDESCNHPPYPSALFHHKICSRFIQGMCPNQPSIALSTRTSIVSLMQSIYNATIHSIELFSKPANGPNEFPSQKTMKPTAVYLHTIVLTVVVVKSQIYSDTTYRRDSGEEIANFFIKISFDTTYHDPIRHHDDSYLDT